MFAREGTPDVIGDEFGVAGANSVKMRAASGHGQTTIGDFLTEIF